MPRAIVLDARDNVATLIDSGGKGEICTLQGESVGEIALLQTVPFGHKVCVRAISAGGDIQKYGQVIGKATSAISAGEHAHTHNVDSARGRGDRAEA